MSTSRILMAMQPLPERERSVRLMMLADDVRDATAKVDRRLRDKAATLHSTGWVEEEDGEFAIVNRTVIGRLRVVRNAS